MMTDKEVIVCNVKDSKIDFINLETKKILQVNHQYLFEDNGSLKLETFSETRLICLIERGGLNDNRLRLTYYDYEGLQEHSKPKIQWVASEGDWTHEHHIQRMNTHSKIGWWLYKQEPEITFKYFDLREDPNGRISSVRTKNNINIAWGINDVSLGINDLWEIKPDKYMLTAFSNKF